MLKENRGFSSLFDVLVLEGASDDGVDAVPLAGGRSLIVLENLV